MRTSLVAWLVIGLALVACGGEQFTAGEAAASGGSTSASGGGSATGGTSVGKAGQGGAITGQAGQAGQASGGSPAQGGAGGEAVAGAGGQVAGGGGGGVAGAGGDAVAGAGGEAAAGAGGDGAAGAGGDGAAGQGGSAQAGAGGEAAAGQGGSSPCDGKPVGDSFCEGATRVACTTSGAVSHECGSEALCQAGAGERCAECIEGFRCTEAALEECKSDGMVNTFQPLDTCARADLCDAVMGVCHAAECPSLDAKMCSGTKLLVCNGSLQWEMKTDCGSFGCDEQAGACSCTAGDRTCVEGQKPLAYLVCTQPDDISLGACGAGLFCQKGSCVACLSDVDCPASGSDCKAPTCTAGVCGFTNIDGKVIPDKDGNCSKSVCQGGQPQPAPDPLDVPTLDCTVGSCNGTTPVSTPAYQQYCSVGYCTPNNSSACCLCATGTTTPDFMPGCRLDGFTVTGMPNDNAERVVDGKNGVDDGWQSFGFSGQLSFDGDLKAQDLLVRLNGFSEDGGLAWHMTITPSYQPQFGAAVQLPPIVVEAQNGNHDVVIPLAGVNLKQLSLTFDSAPSEAGQLSGRTWVSVLEVTGLACHP